MPGKKRLGLGINTWAKSVKQNAVSPSELDIALQAEGKLEAGGRAVFRAPLHSGDHICIQPTSSIRNMPCEM